VQRPLWINLGLLGLVLLLAMLVWLSPEESAAPKQAALTNLRPEQIHTIHIKNRRGAFTLTREGSDWVMTQPHQTPANKARISQLLAIASTHSFERFPLPQEQLQEFGLAEPQATLQLNDTTIQMGNTNPIHHRRYLRIGDTIHLIGDRYPHHLLAAAEGFVALELLPPGSTLRSIQTPEWRLTQEPDGRVTLDPPNPELSADDLNRKFDQWRRARATQIKLRAATETDQPVELTLDNRDTPLRFRLATRDSYTLLIDPKQDLAYILPKDTELLAPPTPKE
jgi:hypothetical protein